jgi:transcriptional regulator with XRE-family HTH domain
MPATTITPSLSTSGERIQERMDELGLSIKDVADKAESTYEHIRKITRGTSFPSKYFIRVLAEVLDMDKQELEELVAVDQIMHKYGKTLNRVIGKNPELDPIEKVWSKLTKDQKADFISQITAVARRNRKVAIA